MKGTYAPSFFTYMKIKTAYILAAGEGNRLDVFETPKPLLKIAGASLIARTLDALLDAGITDVFIVIQKVIPSSKRIIRPPRTYPLHRGKNRKAGNTRFNTVFERSCQKSVHRNSLRSNFQKEPI